MTPAAPERAFLRRYVERAPLALALERVQECGLLSDKRMPRPILDIGCGDGIFAEVLFTDAVDVGLDPDPRELRRAEATGRYRTLLRARADRVPWPDASVGTILCNSVLEHIPEADTVLREARRLLRPGGSMFLTLPTDQFERNTWGSIILEFGRLPGLAAAYRRRFNRFWRHAHCLDLGAWRAMFAQAGFTVADMQTYGSRRRCLVNGALVPLALPGFLARAFLGRWFWLPALRPWTARALLPVATLLLGRDVRAAPKRAGLVFFELHRPPGDRED